MPLFTCLFSPGYFPFPRLWMTITFVIRGSYNLYEQSRFRIMNDNNIPHQRFIASAGRHQTCLPSWRKEWSACVYARYVSSDFLWGPKVINFRRHFWLGIFIQDNLSLNCLKGQISWQHSNARGFADKENPVISCLLISTAYEHPKFQTKQWQPECATFSILTLTYRFQVSQPRTLMVGICGCRLTVSWWASCEDSICWWEKVLQAERNVMRKYLVYGHNWER